MAEGTTGRRRWIVIGILAVIAAAGFFAWRTLYPRESTDDAQVNGHVTPVSTRVGGTVKTVRVLDNQAVKAGDILVEIDPSDYQIALDRAKADLAAAEGSAQAARTAVPISSTTTGSQLHGAEAASGSAEASARASDREVEASQAKLQAAKAHVAELSATATRAAQDLARLKPLAAKDEISKQTYDAAVAAQEAAQAAVASAQASVSEAEANVAVAEARRAQAAGVVVQAQAEARSAATAPQQVALTQARSATADAQVLQARSVVAQAQLNLDRATIVAPVAGVVSRKTIEVGQTVQAGQPLLSLTALNDIWITANFKETQLEKMRPGQHADISIDTYDQPFKGHIDSIAAATGAMFSLLPPDNATGNFVKVVQRIPVKVVLDPGQNSADLLRPGMSADVTIFFK